MKTIYKTTVFTLVICLILASCSRKLTISKRHYKKGYYVSLTKKQPTTPTNTLANNKKNAPLSLNIKENNIETIAATKTEAKSLNILRDNIKPKPIAKNKSSINEKTSPTNKNFVYHYPVKKHQFGESNKNQISKRSSDDGFSLLWIVVVVLIILWALGIISGSFGVGILINLLLVIAFVLLILWLLRII